MPPSIPLSILDLAPIGEGIPTPEAMRQTVELARLGDALGFTRVWYAEHHGMPSIASAAPELLIANAAANTKSIRVGSGGIMLLNHRPLRIVEAFRTLEALHPGRVDLGIGRAPGGDGYAMQALRSGGGEEFSAYLAELLAFDEGGFPEHHPFARVPASPGGVHLPPLWLLGSSGASAAAAGELGMGYSFAAHFSPAPAGPAFDAYRASFRPSAAFPEPRAMIAVSAIVAPTDAEAAWLARSQEVSIALFFTGHRGPLLSPESAHAMVLTEQQEAIIEQQRRLWIIGGPETVKAAIMAKVEESEADEVMVTTTIHAPAMRLRSYRLLAEAFGLTPRG